uniref:Uncharacterized protein n=1 Tax=Laceyella putida TaxID=110101 RepID=A0A0P0UP27_9BACL|nr:hypothetical protein [Laceyella putida]
MESEVVHQIGIQVIIKDDAWLAIVQYPVQLCRSQAPIQPDGNRANFRGGEVQQGEVKIGASEKGNPVSRLNALFEQVVSDLIGNMIKFFKIKTAARPDQCFMTGAEAGSSFEQFPKCKTIFRHVDHLS